MYIGSDPYTFLDPRYPVAVLVMLCVTYSVVCEPFARTYVTGYVIMMLSSACNMLECCKIVATVLPLLPALTEPTVIPDPVLRVAVPIVKLDTCPVKLLRYTKGFIPSRTVMLVPELI